jgi:hypothetical protein
VDEVQSAVVADVGRAVRADRGAVRAAAELGDALDAAVGRHARERATGDLDDEHRAVVEGQRALGETESRRDLPKLHGDSFRARSPCYASALPSR